MLDLLDGRNKLIESLGNLNNEDIFKVSKVKRYNELLNLLDPDFYEEGGPYSTRTIPTERDIMVLVIEGLEILCSIYDMEARVEHDNMWQEGSIVPCETCRGQGVVSYVCSGKMGIEAEYDTDECPDCEGVGWKHNGMNPRVE